MDPTTLRYTMRRWATGVTVLTTVWNGRRAGMTVSSFTSVSLEPPTVLVCLNKDAYAHDLVRQSGVYAVSMLSVGQEILSNRFAGVDPTITDRFEGLELVTAQTGCPLLPGATAWLDCIVKSAHDTFTHTIFVAEVVFARYDEERPPLVYHNRGYHSLIAVEQPQL